ncbi:MAG: hypothetical protein ACRDN0_25525 [Trebonia sp.]
MTARRLGIGLISVGWMGRAHSRAYRNVGEHYPELTIRPELVVAADIAPAAAAGQPFWIEKPMGRGLAESDDIARAAARAGLVTAVGFSYRHPPAVVKARELIAAGRLAEIGRRRRPARSFRRRRTRGGCDRRRRGEVGPDASVDNDQLTSHSGQGFAALPSEDRGLLHTSPCMK